MDFGSVLSRAWQIIWKHKVLWIFGILAGCGSAGQNAPNARTSYNWDVPLHPDVQRYFQLNIPDWQIALIVAVALLVVLVLIVLTVFLSTIGRVGLIRGTQQVEGGAVSLAFGELFSGSMPYFWRVFGLNLLVGIVSFVVIIGVLLLAVFGTVLTFGLGLLCLIPLICLLVPLTWFLSVVVEQASISIVLDNLGVLEGLQRGWDLVRANLGPIIVMGLILTIGVGLIGGFIIGLPVVLIIIPAVIGALADSPEVMGGGFFVAGLCFVGYLPIAIFLNGILRGYIETAWTLTYMKLTGRTAATEEAPLEIA
ncbi:MAG TPA: hypothetical protein VLA49_16605 [Anaerolineales bacterium]|nr:hypothetical protein [Anaerolineales bacterium]